MANEATLIVETEIPINMTCANATGIEKGAILKLTDPNTAIAASASNDYVAGIAAHEKIASDGVTKIPVYRGGVFKVTLSGSCTAGDPLVVAEANKVCVFTSKTTSFASGASGSNLIGTALETGTNGETILMDLRPVSVRAVQY